MDFWHLGFITIPGLNQSAKKESMYVCVHACVCDNQSVKKESMYACVHACVRDRVRDTERTSIVVKQNKSKQNSDSLFMTHFTLCQKTTGRIPIHRPKHILWLRQETLFTSGFSAEGTLIKKIGSTQLKVKARRSWGRGREVVERKREEKRERKKKEKEKRASKCIQYNINESVRNKNNKPYSIYSLTGTKFRVS